MKLITKPIFKKALIASCLCLLVSACASHHGAARIVSIPAGAKVVNIDDGSIVGTTPLVLNFKNTNSERLHLPVKLVKEGYYDKVESFWLSMRHASQKDAESEPKVVEVELVKRGSYARIN